MSKVAIYHMALDPIRKGCIEVQIDILKHYATTNGWEITKIYYDNTNRANEKSELRQLIEDSKKGDFDIVLMKNAYFISRRTPQFIEVWKQLKMNNVTLYTLCEGKL